MTRVNGKNNAGNLIGYSAFNAFEQCYEYNENACYVADTPGSLREFLVGAMLPAADYRTDEVKFSDILNDYGCSCGEFGLEPEALKRFKEAADLEGLEYSVERFDDTFITDPPLYVVKIGWKAGLSHPEGEQRDQLPFERAGGFNQGEDRLSDSRTVTSKSQHKKKKSKKRKKKISKASKRKNRKK